MLLVKEILYITIPLLISGILHHFLVIPFDLFNFLAKPIDSGVNFNNKRLLGNSKTWRGLIAVSLSTSFTMWGIHNFISIPINYHPAITGFVLGFGYSLIELPNSFFKRQRGIKESSKQYANENRIFYLLDHIDSIVGVLIFLPLVYQPSLNLILSLFIIGSGLHFLVDIILYKFGYKKLQN